MWIILPQIKKRKVIKADKFEKISQKTCLIAMSAKIPPFP
jgi:hypothetical protein